MNFIGRAWRGEENLWIVFWIYGLLGYPILNVVMNLVIPHSAFSHGAIWAVYTIWLLIVTWRCAFNTQWKFLGHMVRSLVIMQALFLTIVLAILGLTTFTATGKNMGIGMKCALELKERAKAQDVNEDDYMKAHQSEVNECWERRAAEFSYEGWENLKWPALERTVGKQAP